MPATSDHGAHSGAEMESLLVRAFATTPPAAQLDRMDTRLRRALDLGPARLGRRERRLRRAGWIALAAAAIFVLGGAGAVVLQRFEDWSGPDFDVAWERGSVLGLTAESQGYELTLERAYADAGQVMLAMAIEDPEQRERTIQLSVLAGSLVDEDGEMYELAGGMSGPVDAHESLELWYLDPPAFPIEPGPRQFTLTVDRIEVLDPDLLGPTPDPEATEVVGVPSAWRGVDGDWVIDFELDVQGGSYVEADAIARGREGIDVRVTSLLITPTRARLELSIEGVERPEDWSPLDVTATRGGTTIAFGGQGTTGDGDPFVLAMEGMDAPKGRWTISIGELAGPPARLPQPNPDPSGVIPEDGERVLGPWVATVDIK